MPSPQVKGEVFLVDEPMLSQLDFLENHPTYYRSIFKQHLMIHCVFTVTHWNWLKSEQSLNCHPEHCNWHLIDCNQKAETWRGGQEWWWRWPQSFLTSIQHINLSLFWHEAVVKDKWTIHQLFLSQAQYTIWSLKFQVHRDLELLGLPLGEGHGWDAGLANAQGI